MSEPSEQWWTINGEAIMSALRQAHDGIDPGIVYLELIANSTTDGMPRGGASSVRKARKKLQQRDPMVDVSIAAEACRRADSGGSPRLPAVTDALAEAGLPCSPGQARKMIERAIGAGMIAPGRRGRPPSIARPRATTTKETP